MGVEIERKYLIAMPDLLEISKFPEYQAIYILQTYLDNRVLSIIDTDFGEYPADTEVRVRLTCDEYGYARKLTIKSSNSGLVRQENEVDITEDEYNEYLRFADDNMMQIIKRRHRFRVNNKIFEIDIYGFCIDKAILEVELDSPDESFDIPDCIRVIREVTDDKKYRNKSLAESFGRVMMSN